MKKNLLSLALIALGAGAWWIIARTARFSIKKWDAKFETVLRHSLTSSGFTDQDVLSSVHEIKKDAHGEWVVHRVSLSVKDHAKRKQLLDELENSGARIQQTVEDNAPVYMIKRGTRIYQEISFR